MEEKKPISKPQAEEFISITDLWHASVSHWYLFVISIGICVGLGYYYYLNTPDIYTRQAAVLVKDEKKISSNKKSSGSDGYSDLNITEEPTNINNVMRQLTSIDLLSEVAQRLDMTSAGQTSRSMAQKIQKNLKIEMTEEKSTVLDLTYTSQSADQADSVLTTIYQVYNERWMRDKNNTNASIENYLDEQLSQVKQDLDKVDDSISDFKARNQITDIGQANDVYLAQQTQADEKLQAIDDQRANVKRMLAILNDSTELAELIPTDYGLNNQVAEDQIKQYNDAVLQYREDIVGTTDANPIIKEELDRMSEIRKSIIASVRNQLSSLNVQSGSYKDITAKAEQKITSSPEKSKKLVANEREQKVKESRYIYLLEKQAEYEICMTDTSKILDMIDMPHGDSNPTSPNERNILFGAVLLGLLLPTIFVFIRKNLDTVVHSRKDVENRSTLSIVGEIPHSRRLAHSLFGRLLFWRKKTPFVVKEGKQNYVNEAFRFIRSNLEFMTPKRGEKNVYLVTSNHKGSGKTLIAENLGIALAINGREVLLVDGDLRHASVSHHFDCNGLGLADYLGENETDIDNVITDYKPYPTLHLLPVGTNPPNPTELLSSERFRELIELLRYKYDFIIIDCPPADYLADVDIIEHYIDRTLFIIRAGLFERNQIEKLDNDVANGKYKNTSLILNDVKYSHSNERHHSY